MDFEVKMHLCHYKLNLIENAYTCQCDYRIATAWCAISPGNLSKLVFTPRDLQIVCLLMNIKSAYVVCLPHLRYFLNCSVNFIFFPLDITVMECLSRTFEVKTIPLQVPYLGPDVSILPSLVYSQDMSCNNHRRIL